MHDVSNAINQLDPNKGSIDGKICGSGANNWVKNDGGDAVIKEEANKCGGLKNGATESNFKKLSHMFAPEAPATAAHVTYPEDKDKKMGEHTSAKISKDMSNLTREQKGVISSAFAKAHEGARYTSRRISTYEKE